MAGKDTENEAAAAPAEELSDEAKAELKKKAKKKLIIVIAAVLAMIVIGAGIFLSGVLKKDVPEGEEHAEEAAEGAEGHGEAGAKGKEEDSKKQYLNIGEFLVNLNSSGKQASFLKMSVTMEVVGAENKKAVEENLPRIKDTFQTYLRELRAEDLKGSAGVYRLREALLIRVNKVLHPAQVSDILFEELIVQ